MIIEGPTEASYCTREFRREVGEVVVYGDKHVHGNGGVAEVISGWEVEEIKHVSGKIEAKITIFDGNNLKKPIKVSNK